MNYRHIFHAGNFADVFKHIVLVALAQSFLRKETPFCYLDTHAGIGRYDLFSGAAIKGKEFKNGIVKLLNAKDVPALVADYLAIITKKNPSSPPLSKDGLLRFYPGSPFIMKEFLRANDRMILSELNREDFQTLKRYFSADNNTQVLCQDGYASLKAFLPPKEKRGLVLIDPPYENDNEFTAIIQTLQEGLQRFETGIYAIWYPIKSRQQVERLHKMLKNKITQPILITELSVYPENLPTHLNGSGLAIVNPPWQLDKQLQDTLPWLWKTLSPNSQGQYTIRDL